MHQSPSPSVSQLLANNRIRIDDEHPDETRRDETSAEPTSKQGRRLEWKMDAKGVSAAKGVTAAKSKEQRAKSKAQHTTEEPRDNATQCNAAQRAD